MNFANAQREFEQCWEVNVVTILAARSDTLRINDNDGLKPSTFSVNFSNAQREFEQRRFDIMARIGPELSKVVEHYANENNFYLILDSSSQNTQVVFNAASLDLTMDIIKQFNLSQNSSSNPATGSSLSK